MSSIDFANYLKNRMATLNMGPTKAAERSGLTRQAWHKLLNADVGEAKISTLCKLAKALHTTPEYLLHIYYQDERKASERVMQTASVDVFIEASAAVPANDQDSFMRLHKLFEHKGSLHLHG
ncbi:MAG: helix-turn-helix transcriptional regulator [Gammaproteobacteria bacterium]|nr:helix-turn-helix transcriptional regulator [Gammaproteobacteria bacterium]MBU1725965.1 helix-turn-helix transcriptional regulator [Gammaproteobacteria bacterium]MBU2006069.1 helix-turn-helix transcriptional regulator [Gammaproteobacteria bacterium]